MTSQSPLTPSASDINFLTQKINDEAKKLGIREEAYPFGFFIHDKDNQIIAGCNGSIIYGSIYTDQLWVHQNYRGQGLGKQLMEKVHHLGKSKNCSMATVATMSFQRAQEFYESIGYVVDFEREGYTGESKCLFLKKIL